ncbi:nucleoid occlusion protein [Tumebacillus sp. ITR2]|uniref:Nucleoid occlusion protein n=1 Tax=Tumebacillus amylolyticus TaxID=2801339 RepID=A0ABS1J445_9BACL|nr:nucleoid occlusion protein [Tumebacillus amylolyticus]MBL0385029.1 nucleoid occlusion protein [Tumebacillus amylolyticus]
MKEQLSRIFGLGERESDNGTGNGSNQEEVRQIPIGQIVSSPYQPRTIFDDERIEELAQTIRTHGMIQPIVVRKVGETYELIAGERRWRACTKLGFETIPAIIRELNDSQAASVALIENLQREGLTAIEEAVAYSQLLELHGLTQESLAQRLGKGQSTIANKLRLLNLPRDVQEALMARKVSERHARALLALPSEELQLKVLAEVIEKEMNVKQTEARIKLLVEAETPAKKPRKISFSRDIRLAVNTIRQSLDMIVQSGIHCEKEEEDHEEYYQFVIRVPKTKS